MPVPDSLPGRCRGRLTRLRGAGTIRGRAESGGRGGVRTSWSPRLGEVLEDPHPMGRPLRVFAGRWVRGGLRENGNVPEAMPQGCSWTPPPSNGAYHGRIRHRYYRTRGALNAPAFVPLTDGSAVEGCLRAKCPCSPSLQPSFPSVRDIGGRNDHSCPDRGHTRVTQTFLSPETPRSGSECVSSPNAIGSG